MFAIETQAMYKEQKSDINSEDIKAHETKTRHVRISQFLNIYAKIPKCHVCNGDITNLWKNLQNGTSKVHDPKPWIAVCNDDTKTENLDVLAMNKEKKSDINSEDIQAHQTKTTHVRISPVWTYRRKYQNVLFAMVTQAI